MERTDEEQLNKLREQGIKIYSISRLNALNQCPYQAYLNYIKGEKQTNLSPWSSLGGKCHDALQGCIDGTCNEDAIKQAITDELEDLDLLGVEFPKDRNGNDSIRNNWIANMTRFSQEFKTPKGKFETEKLILYPIDNAHYMQGYIDLTKFNNDGTIDIIDWKTSSQFDKNHLIEAGRQLILYGLAKQAEGYKIRKLQWVMLKYCITSWKLKNGKTKEKISEWRNLIKDLENPITKSLKDLGIDDVEIDILMSEGIEKNSWAVFPQEVQDKFTTKIYVRDYDFSQENIDETLDYIKDKINQYETREEWEPCNIDKESFFCNSLCGFGGKTGKCKYYVDYLDKFENTSEDDEYADLF